MPKYKVTINHFPHAGEEIVYKHVEMDELFKIMNQFKNDHPGCYLFKPVCNSSIMGMIESKNGDIHGFVVEMDED